MLAIKRTAKHYLLPGQPRAGKRRAARRRPGRDAVTAAAEEVVRMVKSRSEDNCGLVPERPVLPGARPNYHNPPAAAYCASAWK